MNIFEEVLRLILRFTLPILFIVLVLTLINIINNYRKYGTKIFSSFKKYNLNGKMKSLVIDILNRESHKEVLIVDSNKDYFYAITNYNIFAIFVFDYDGPLTGSITSAYLKCNNNDVTNPILNFLDKSNKVLNQEINLQMIYINSKRNIPIRIEGVEEILTLKEFSYKIYQKQHSNVKYTKDEMIILKRKIEDIVYDNNQN